MNIKEQIDKETQYWDNVNTRILDDINKLKASLHIAIKNGTVKDISILDEVIASMEGQVDSNKKFIEEMFSML